MSVLAIATSRLVLQHYQRLNSYSSHFVLPMSLTEFNLVLQVDFDTSAPTGTCSGVLTFNLIDPLKQEEL